MEIWNKIRGAFKNDAQTYKMSDIIELFSGKTGTYTADISEVTYFTCMKRCTSCFVIAPSICSITIFVYYTINYFMLVMIIFIKF